MCGWRFKGRAKKCELASLTCQPVWDIAAPFLLVDALRFLPWIPGSCQREQEQP